MASSRVRPGQIAYLAPAPVALPFHGETQARGTRKPRAPGGSLAPAYSVVSVAFFASPHDSCRTIGPGADTKGFVRQPEGGLIALDITGGSVHALDQ